MWEYQCQVVNVVDGDTIDLLVDTGFYQRIEVRVRLKGVDTAEIYGVKKESDEYEEGVEHANFVSDWFGDGQSNHDGDWPFVLESEKRGKYGRWLAESLVRKSDDADLIEDLIVEYPEVEDK